MGLAEYLGLHPRFVESTMTGGSSYEVHVEHAAAAIAAGLCDVVVSVYAATPRSDRTRSGRTTFGGRTSGRPNLGSSGSCPYGLRMPMGPYALAASRHIGEFGTTSEQLAQIAVSTRQWARAATRERAYRDPITIDDVLASPLQCSPLHLLDCCLVTDGAGAFVMTSAERARSICASRPSTCSAPATCTDHMMISQMPDLTTTPGAVLGAERLRHGRARARRRRRADGLRQLHHHRRCCTSRTSASAPRARAARSWPTASSARRGRCR